MPRWQRAAEARLARPIRLVGPDGHLAATSGEELRARPRVDEALDTVREDGTVGRVLARLGLRDGPDVEVAYRIAPVPAARLANRLDRRFAEPSRDARVVVGDGAVRVVEARSGTGVDRGALRRALRALPSRVELRIVPARPVVSTAEAEAAAARVERLLDGPRRVRFRDVESTLTPRRLRALTRTEREDGTLGVGARPDGPRRVPQAAPRQVRACPPRRHIRRRGTGRSRRPLEARPSPGRGADRTLARLEPRSRRPISRDSRRPHRRSRPRRPRTSTSGSRSRSSRPTTRAVSRA